MPDKNKKKRNKNKKEAEKEKKTIREPLLNERETVFYEQQRILNNEHLQSQVEIQKEKLAKLEEDRADVVSHLKRTLQQKTEEVGDLSDRCLSMEKLAKDEQIAHKKKKEAMELEYKIMETNLSTEVKLASGHLYALDDTGKSRIDLMRKFEIQEEQMAEQKKRHEKTLYEAEKFLIIERVRMRKEMEERVNELAQNFREATDIRTADSTRRAISENILLNMELDATYKVCRQLDAKTREHEEEERDLRINSLISQSQAKMALEKMDKQNRSIAFEKSVHAKICHGEASGATKKQIVENCSDKCLEEQKKARILEQNIEKTRKERVGVVESMKCDIRKIRRLESILDSAQRYLTEIVRIAESICVVDDCNAQRDSA